jgi:hypothetical protein
MTTNIHTASAVSDEGVAITLPATALARLGGSFGGQFSSGHSAGENGSSMIAAAATQSEPFPCFKKCAWSDQALVKVVQTQGAPGAC